MFTCIFSFLWMPSPPLSSHSPFPPPSLPSPLLPPLPSLSLSSPLFLLLLFLFFLLLFPLFAPHSLLLFSPTPLTIFSLHLSLLHSPPPPPPFSGMNEYLLFLTKETCCLYWDIPPLLSPKTPIISIRYFINIFTLYIKYALFL